MMNSMMNSMMKLLSVSNVDRDLVLNYEASHSTPGREGSTLTFGVTVVRIGGYQTPKTKLIIHMDPVEKETQEECMEKMSEWLLRASEALKVTPVDSIPLYKIL